MHKPPTFELVEFLLAEATRAAAAARRLSETALWKEALALARAWNVIPSLYFRIKALGVELTAADTAVLKVDFLTAYRQSAFRAGKAIAAIRGLEAAGIPVAAFKGIASMAVLYGDAKYRAIHDADILILPKDVPRAIACLDQQGFLRRGSETLAEYTQFVENSPGFAGNKAVALYGDQGSEIDLHWGLAGSGLVAEGILDRAVEVHFMDSTIRVVDSKDGFLLTVHHAIRENLAIDTVCRDLLDVRMWCARLRETGQLEAAMDWAARSCDQVSVLAVTSLLSGYDPATDAAEAARLLCERMSAAEIQSAARLAELFHYQLRNGRLGKDVFYMVHSRPWRQILKGLGTDWFGYRRSMQTIEKQLEQERPLSQRIGDLAKSVPGLRGLRLARELARIKYRAN